MSLLPRLFGLKTRRSFVNILMRSSKVGYCTSRNLKGLVLGIYQRDFDGDWPKLTPTGESIDHRSNGRLMELIRETNITGAPGKGKVFMNLEPEFQAIAVVGLGSKNAGFNELEFLDEGLENVRIAAGVGAGKLQDLGCTEIWVEAMRFAEQAAEGCSLAVYKYQDTRDRQKRILAPKLELYDSMEYDYWTRGLFKAEAQNLARRLSETPANIMTPTAFAQAAMDVLCSCGVTVEVRTLDWIEQNNLLSFLTVARGSCEPPILLELTYCGRDLEERPVLLLGKGITFNSGGLCLREKEDMSQYRASMAGAAVVIATMRAAAALSLPMNLIGIVPLCENLPSGMAVKPGDVISCLNGKTIAVQDTDRAGVVMMIDPLIYGQVTFKPRLVIDVATLGDGIRQALGGGATGVWVNSPSLWEQFCRAGALTGDRMWLMPTWEYYRQHVIDQYLSYDLTNFGDNDASSCLAAAILKEFVPCVEWAHLDIRGVGMQSRHGSIPYLMKHRMTGRPTRTLIQCLYQIACPGEQLWEKAYQPRN